jgi:hypothetical protein
MNAPNMKHAWRANGAWRSHPPSCIKQWLGAAVNEATTSAVDEALIYIVEFSSRNEELQTP